MKKLKRVLVIINLKSLIITILAVVSTYLCKRFDIVAEFPMTLVATAVVFPIVFSISGAYKRRENALTKYSSMKANGRALFFAARDWIKDSDDETQKKAKELLGNLLTASRDLFNGPIPTMREREDAVYRLFSHLSKFISIDLGNKGLPSGELSRANQYLCKMMVAFEDAKHIYMYRTPRTLSAFSDFFVTVLPILYGPYFVAIAMDFSYGLVYVMPVLFTIILVSLDNIQEQLENPFDQIGEDDIQINAEKFVERLEVD